MKRFLCLLFVILLLLLCTGCVFCDEDVGQYETDVEKYCAGAFMPALDQIGTYEDVSYLCRRDESIFPSYSMRLIARYEQDVFSQEAARLETAYQYLDKPQVADWDDRFYTIPAERFSAAGFDFRVVRLEDSQYPKNIGLVGVSEERHEIAYLWFYCPDHDYLCEVGEDGQACMTEWVEYQFKLS